MFSIDSVSPIGRAPVSPAAPTQAWMFGPVPDLVLGCGGGYAVIFLLILLKPSVLEAYAPIGLLPLVVLVTGIPHYGATLMRVYGRSEDLDRYRVFSVWISAAIYAWFVVGVYHVALGSWLVTLYLTWSPWHYSGQNYGVAMIFLGRRGIKIPERSKRLLYASFVLSYAIAFLGIHRGGASQSYTEIGTYRLIRLGIDQATFDVLLPTLVAGYLASSALALYRLGRGRSFADLAPILWLMALQAIWFCIPTLISTGVFFGVKLAPDLLVYNLLWMGIAHAVQYLWVTYYYAKRSDSSERVSQYIGWALLAGGAAWGIPAFAFAPDVLGTRAYDFGLAILVASAVNVHHFMLDGAIWKLRDGPVARRLLRSNEVPVVPENDRDRHPVLRRATAGIVIAGGLAYSVAAIVGTLEAEFGVRRAADTADLARMNSAVQRLRWVGRDHPGVRYDLGMAELAQGNLDAARHNLERSIDLARDEPASWVGLGMLAEKEQRLFDALEAYEAALSLDPNNLAALTRKARLLRLGGDSGGASALLRRALEVDPENEKLRAWHTLIEGDEHDSTRRASTGP